MGFSYSFHLSAKSHAVSTVGKICQCSRHNLREYKSDHYDRSQIEILAGSTASILEDVKRVYEYEFNDCLQKYNEGKRADRQIKNYLEHVSNSRSDVAAEIIIQIGDMEFWADKSMQQKKQMSYIFKDQLRSLQKLCPEFKIASAVIHYDESSPHMHVIGVPIATDYKRGMEKQVAKTKVFTADRLSFLQDKMRENAEKGMELNADLFQGKQLKAKSKGRNKDIPKESLAEFYSLQKNIEHYKKLETEIDELDEPVRTIIPNTVTIKKQDFELMKEQAKGYIANRNEIAAVRHRQAALKKREQQLNLREREIDRKADDVDFLYERQMNINRILEETEDERDRYRARNDALERENASLRVEVLEMRERFADQIDVLKSRVRRAYGLVSEIVKAVGMLKYSRNSKYRVENLTESQANLIDRIRNYAVEKTRKAGFKILSEEMKDEVSLSPMLSIEIEKVHIEPEKPTPEYELDLEHELQTENPDDDFEFR